MVYESKINTSPQEVEESSSSEAVEEISKTKSYKESGESSSSEAFEEFNKFTLGYYCYLAFNTVYTPKNESDIDKTKKFSNEEEYLNIFYDIKKINTHIGSSRNPDIKVSRKNKKKVSNKKSNKEKVDLITPWKIGMIIGPFKAKEISFEFKEAWRKGTRGINSRLGTGKELANFYYEKGYINIICYDPNKRNELINV
jgi:hypothetical protein